MRCLTRQGCKWPPSEWDKKINQAAGSLYLTPGGATALQRPLHSTHGTGLQTSLQTLNYRGNPGHSVWLSRCQYPSHLPLLAPPWAGAQKAWPACPTHPGIGNQLPQKLSAVLGGLVSIWTTVINHLESTLYFERNHVLPVL